MKITKDTQKMTDPNEFGETLRDYCFIPDKYGWGDYGCYSTFELRPEFKQIFLPNPIYTRLWKLAGMDNIDDIITFYCYSNGTIHLGWYWDGDGTLIIQEGDKIACNDDCKKDYNWHWLGENGEII